MHFKLLGLSLVTGMMSATAFAEPAIQPGDTLESLSKVKVNTTVNGQAGSIENLVASGQIRIVEAGQVAAESNLAGSETELQTSSATDNSTAPQTADLNTPAQANAPAIEQTAQAASENVDPMQPNGELAAQQAEQGADQEIAAAPVSQSTADTPVNAANMPQADTTPESATIAPANIAGVAAPQEAFAATPEAAPQPDDAVQAAPATEVTDTPVNASPEMPVADATEN